MEAGGMRLDAQGVKKAYGEQRLVF